MIAYIFIELHEVNWSIPNFC